jgi:hypothetical protein
MIHMGAKAKLVGAAEELGIELVIGRKGGALQAYEIPLHELDALISALQRQRDDAHEFFRRAGVLPEIAPRAPRTPKPHTALRAVSPHPPREEITREFSSDTIPTPILPPPTRPR